MRDLESKKSVNRCAALGALLGLLVALVITAASHFLHYMLGSPWVAFWPASIMLMALETNSRLLVAIAVWLLAAVINMLIYAILAAATMWIFQMIRSKTCGLWARICRFGHERETSHDDAAAGR